MSKKQYYTESCELYKNGCVVNPTCNSGLGSIRVKDQKGSGIKCQSHTSSVPSNKYKGIEARI